MNLPRPFSERPKLETSRVRTTGPLRGLLPLVGLLLFVASPGPAFAQVDLSTIAITSPVSGCGLSSTQAVTMRIFNFGSNLSAGTSFNVSYTINAGAPVTELVTLGSPFLSNSTLNYSFTTQANLSTPGSYTFDATCSLAGDVNPANNWFSGYVVTNSAPSAAGTIGGQSQVCVSGNSGTLALSGQTGSVLRWESSADGGSTWFNISNTTTSQPFSNLTVPTSFRAVVQNGSCPSATTAAFTIGIDPATVGGTLNPASFTACAVGNSGTISLSGKTGTVLRWEFSTDGGSTWNNIANTTTSQSYTNLASTRIYRALVQSGSCPAAYSATATVTVAPPSVGGTVSPASASTCVGSGSGSFTLSGQTGSVLRWESSTDGGATWSIISNTTATLAWSAPTEQHLYRVRVQSSPCAATYSSVATLSIASPVSIDQQPASAVVCAWEPASFHVVTTAPSVAYQWQVDAGTGFQDLDGSGPYSGVTSANLTISSASPTFDGQRFRCNLTVTGCGPVSSSAATLEVAPLPSQPGAFTTATPTVYRGDSGVRYEVPPNTGVSAWYWLYYGNGATVAPQGNSARIDFAADATSGTLAVVPENSCGLGPARYLSITVTATGFPGEVPGDQLHGAPLRLSPNPIDPSHVDLSWGASCGTGVVDYAVYEGSLGTADSLAPAGCSTLGGYSYPNLVPASGDRIFLVVPLSSTREGSYGRDSDGTPIPQAASPCRSIQNLFPCP
jgi:hypothetical protein